MFHGTPGATRSDHRKLLLIVLLGAVALVVHLLTNIRYSYFMDAAVGLDAPSVSASTSG
jgi:hypothetical protein